MYQIMLIREFNRLFGFYVNYKIKILSTKDMLLINKEDLLL